MPFPLMALIGLAASAASSAMDGGGRKRSAFDRRAGDLEMGLLEGTGTDWLNSPTIGGMAQLLRQLLQERQGLQGITQASPQIQGLARQAAFAPVQAVHSQLGGVLQQALEQASARGIPYSTILGGLQGQGIQQLMAPALAQAQGTYAQSLLDLPFRERQFGLQSIGLGQSLAGQQQGLRESAFNQLQQALARGQFQQQQRSGAGRRFLGGALGA